jgi:hypothetical protein
MQTCSNCGASNREGAKFCTTCGTRLNPVVSSGSSGWGALDDDATRGETSATTTTTEEPTTTEAPSWSAQEPVATAWSWNQTRTSEELAVPVTSTDEPAATPTTTSSWASQWTSAETDDFGDDDDEPASTTTTTGAPVWDSPDPVVADATTTTEAPSWTTTPSAPEPAVVDNTTPVDDVIAVEPTADVPETLAPDDTASTSTEPPGAGNRARAQELIAELQALIDTGFPEPAADANGDAASALTALATLGDDDGSRFDGLREVVEKARTQPRDLDTMLGLIGQIESIADLLDAYEAQRTAIAEAKATLQP